MTKLEKENARLKKELKILEKVRTDLASELADTKDSLKDADSMLADWKGSLEYSRREFSDKAESYSKLHESYSKLYNDYELLQRDAANLKQALECEQNRAVTAIRDAGLARVAAEHRAQEVEHLKAENLLASKILREIGEKPSNYSASMTNFLIPSVAAMLEGGLHVRDPYIENVPRYNVYLTDCRYDTGAKRISLIKFIREATGIGLAEAKALTDPAYAYPPQKSLLAHCVNRETAERWMAAINDSFCKGSMERYGL